MQGVEAFRCRFAEVEEVMANILDYLRWRGDLILEQADFNEVDSLILSELSYLNFSGIAEGEEGISIRDATEAYFQSGRQSLRNTGDLYNENYFELLQRMAESRRFADMRLRGYVQKFDTEIGMQFSAVTVEIGRKKLYVAFRGTDDTLLGWKEDFMMSALTVVPSQQEAVQYLKRAAEYYPGYRILTGGHSKGGNLAVYASLHAGKRVQKRIWAVYNHDGPGFRDSVVETPEYQNIAACIRTMVPETSVVGMLLEHEEHYSVVKSSNKGFTQHDGFSWEVCGPEFVHLSSVSRESKMADMAIRQVFAELSLEQRLQLTNALFDTLGAKNSRTLTDIREGKKGIKEILRAYDGLDKDARKILQTVLSKIVTESIRGYKVTKEAAEQQAEEEATPSKRSRNRKE